MKKIFLASALVVALGTAGNASAITLNDNTLTDWGMASVDGFTTSDGPSFVKIGASGGVKYWEEKGAYSNGAVGPGGGGIPFDIAGAYYTTDAANMYFAFVVGMGESGTVYDGETYTMGDIAISFDNGASYKYGIETRGANKGTLYDVNSWQNPGAYPYSTPFDINTVNSTIGSASLFYQAWTGTDYYIIEAQISKSLFTGLNDYDPSKMYIHLTPSCGNDVVNLPVAEPSTLLLLGSGLVGLGVFGRRKKA